MSDLLDRAEAAELEAGRQRERADALQERVEAIISGHGYVPSEQHDQTLLRANNSESLLRELLGWIMQNPSLRELMPTGWTERVQAQLRADRLDPLDLAALGLGPPLERLEAAELEAGRSRPDPLIERLRTVGAQSYAVMHSPPIKGEPNA